MQAYFESEQDFSISIRPACFRNFDCL